MNIKVPSWNEYQPPPRRNRRATMDILPSLPVSATIQKTNSKGGTKNRKSGTSGSAPNCGKSEDIETDMMSRTTRKTGEKCDEEEHEVTTSKSDGGKNGDENADLCVSNVGVARKEIRFIKIKEN